MTQTHPYDIAIIGGSMGGVAAALAACDAGRRVLLTEETGWLGGQMTSQGVSALDEHRYIEHFGGTASYYALRTRIRHHYQKTYGAPATMPDGEPLNPGNGWVSRLCFEPVVGLQALYAMIQPHVDAGRLTLLLHHRPVAATVTGETVQAVTLAGTDGQETSVEAAYFLDATDLGDLLPLTGTAYTTGAEAQAETGEPQAETMASATTVQGFTYCFFVEFRPGERHVIDKPAGYEALRDRRPYTLALRKPDGSPYPFRFFARSITGNPPFWTYRRVRDGRLLDPSCPLTDIALINWESNDYPWATLLDVDGTEKERALAEAKALSLGFLYYLQTELPRDDGEGLGYPELLLRADIAGTEDGLCKTPYIREARRIVARKRIVEQEIVVGTQNTDARAVHFPDSVGIGWYNIDVHHCVGSARSIYAPTLPFQIPLGALLPVMRTNLLAACKNIGTTHITNGAYRLHPVEWNIGEAAGALAAFCLDEACTPAAVWASQGQAGIDTLLRRLQRRLIARGVPLTWAVDVGLEHEDFAATQWLLIHNVLAPDDSRRARLDILPADPLAPATADAIRALLGESPVAEPGCLHTWQNACARCRIPGHTQPINPAEDLV